MARDDVAALLEEETLQMEAFSVEVRERMRLLMREIELEFQQFMERMLAEQGERFDKETQALLASQSVPSFGDFLGEASSGGSFDTDSLFSRVLGSTVSAAIGSVSRTGSLNPRAILNAGGRSIGSALGREVVSSTRAAPEQMRLSRSQKGAAIMRDIQRAGKND